MVSFRMFVGFLLREKRLTADRTSDLSNICPGRHRNNYADMIFNGFKHAPINNRNLKILSLDKVRFSRAERDFLFRNEACRIGTCHGSIPHVTPVSYVFQDGVFYIATDYETRKYENIKGNNRVALAIDVYSSTGNKAVCVQGRAEIIENGTKFAELYKIFEDRFEWVRQDPWAEGEAPFLKVTPTGKVSWGL
jgi:nitroimidazol reductase NimA-like FMN-containing flavoprotein (pyridoxamine 5'-phosphate oxidase superfamily)